MIFELVRSRKQLYIGVLVAPWKFNVVKTNIFALEASLIEQIFL